MYYEAGPRITEPVRSSKAALLKRSGIDPAIAAALDSFSQYSRACGVAPGTLRALCIYLAQYLVWCYENGIDPVKATTMDIIAYRTATMEKNRYRSTTVNAKIGALAAYYRQLFYRGDIMASPVKPVCYVKYHRALLKTVLSIEDMGKLLNGIILSGPFDYLFKSVCELLYSSGLRISECLSLKEESIDRETGYITLHDAKAGRIRTVPAGEVALRWYKRYMTTYRKQLVSLHDRERGYSYPQKKYFAERINNRLVNECRRHGLPKQSAHSFRHACATHMLQKGATIKQAQEFLGHTAITTTQIYTHIVKNDLKKIVAAYHPRGGEA